MTTVSPTEPKLKLPDIFPHTDSRVAKHRAVLVSWLGINIYNYTIIPSSEKHTLPNGETVFVYSAVSNEADQGVAHHFKVFLAERYCGVANVLKNHDTHVYIERIKEDNHQQDEEITVVSADSLETLTYMELEICKIYQKPTYFAFNVDGVTVTTSKNMITALNEFLHHDYFAGAEVFWSPFLLQSTDESPEIPKPPTTLNVLLFIVKGLQHSFGVSEDKVHLHSEADGLFNALQ